ncbi:DUF5995 family protein [Nocardioides terrisoli]|uniref:DUF5995 family protein n=1 Tax=Nocardioides terrisoli TaxID=3388267 RepID=UPI00287B75FE|nr:DUF5995 family protein [Nocardioides marmorisolisilvae]
MRLLKVLLVLSVLIVLACAPAHATATGPGGGPGNPLGTLVTPELTDPVIAALPALPTPYRPYRSSICRSAKPACIDRVITTMQRRLQPLARSCSHDAIFALAYLRVTQNVKNATDHGYFADRRWLTRLDAVFAHMYFRTMDRYRDGRGVPPAWKVALDASHDRQMNGLGDFMLNMNAHINNDFPRALVVDGLTAKDGTSHKPDHNAYNDRLDTLYGPVFGEEARRFDPTFNTYDVPPFTLTAAGTIMRLWREAVWRNAEMLADARTPQQRAMVGHYIDQYAATQARMIKAMPIFRSTDHSKARDAYCATHR